ncbi:MAG: AarF/UbiB family protein [Chloroflexi bacterium]|nr:AarF/UbiB family protein [Chloroflexota bacterium]
MNLRRFHNLGRYHEIVTILARHGFGSILEKLQVNRRLSLPIALLKQKPSEHHTPAEHLRLACEELGPTFIKLGQVLSTRPDLLPPDYITELSKLRDNVPPNPWQDVRAILTEEWGKPPEQIFASIDPQPLGAASLAQVYAATLPLESASGEQSLRQVVIKVQRPNIRAVIDADLEILEDLAALAQRTPIGEVYNPIDVVGEFAFTLRNELDYWREGRNADRFRRNFADETNLYIPKVYWDHTTRRVLVMERIFGLKIDDLAALDAAGYDRHRVALVAARIVVKEILEDGFFHADPHPGNFLVMPGEVLGAMDFGMVGHLTDANRLDVIRLYVAAVRMDVEGVIEQLLRMGAMTGRVDRHALARDVGRFLDKYQGTSLKDVRAGEVVEEIVGIAFRHHLHMPGDLWLVSKAMVMMEGMGLQLDPSFDIYAISKPFADELVKSLWMPNTWLPSILSSLESWRYLLTELPHASANLLRSLEQGDLPVNIQVQARKETMDRLDRLITRLSLSILIAAFVMGLAMVFPYASSNPVLMTLVVIGFTAVLVLGLWLAVSILRPSR